MRLDATALLPFGFDSGATFSKCRKYRYRLWRSWGDREHRIVFVGLNPSTADENVDDPTIRKCVGFAKRWGFGAIDMVNVFAWRSTDPNGLLSATPNHVGPDNTETLDRAFNDAHRIVWCWGKHSARVRRLVQCAQQELGWFTTPKRCEVGTFGRMADGSPRHPLMLPYVTPFVPEPIHG
jgi:hypothetical protein